MQAQVGRAQLQPRTRSSQPAPSANPTSQTAHSKKPQQPSVRGQPIFALGKAKAQRVAWGPVMVASISLAVAACGVCMAVSGIAGLFSPSPPSLELGTMQDGVAMTSWRLRSWGSSP
jgi:predicted phage tail protein